MKCGLILILALRKRIIMNRRAIELITRPRFGLIYFGGHKDIGGWIENNTKEICDNGGTYIKSRNIIKFPNGNILMLGYGDPNKYLSCEFLFVLGTDDPVLKSRVRI
jgi:hypothetical protein